MEENVFSVEYILENKLDKKAYGFIYITKYESNGMKYIGQKIFDNKSKWKSYYGSGTHYKRAEKLYGKQNFNRDIVAIAYSKEELNELEIEFIKNHNAVKSKDYYNIASGGDSGNAGLHHSKETRFKMSVDRKGKNNSNYGKILSKEHKNKLSEAKIGEKHPNYGTHLSEITKRRIGNANKGKRRTNEMILKMSEAQKGKILSEEHKKKIGESNKSKTLSEEHKKKLIESNKNRLGTKRKTIDAKKSFDINKVIEIREKYATRKYKMSELAKEYMVHRQSISNVVNYKHAYK